MNGEGLTALAVFFLATIVVKFPPSCRHCGAVQVRCMNARGLSHPELVESAPTSVS